MTDRGPLPPDDMIVRIGVSTDHFETPEIRAEVFRVMGQAAYQDIVSVLPADWTWAGKRALDFGCGSGRVLRWFAPHIDEGFELVGCDIHAPTIGWMQDAYPDVRSYVNGDQPPLPEPDGSFDLVYCGSVFSHLTDWAPWVLEMRRLLKPGGLLVASIHGRGLWNDGMAAARGERWNEDETGLLVERSGDSFEDSWGPAVYVSEWWLRAHWGRALEIAEFYPSGFALPEERHIGQAWVVARRGDDTQQMTAEDLLAPADDSREMRAALRAQRIAYDEIAEYTRKVAELWRESQKGAKIWDELQATRAQLVALGGQPTGG